MTCELSMLFQLAEIMSGDFDEVLDSWRVVDCRYPYEYINGHLLVRTLTTNYIFYLFGSVYWECRETRRFGPRSFRVSGPVVWNSLPKDIRIPELSLERFKSM